MYLSQEPRTKRTSALPRTSKYQLTWMPESRRWRKFYRGRKYYFPLRPGETRESSYLRCLRAWLSKKDEVDDHSYESLIRSLQRSIDPHTGETVFQIPDRQLRRLLDRAIQPNPKPQQATKRQIHRPFFRYPGGKAKLRHAILNRLVKLSRHRDMQYREPFFGGGSVGLQLILDNPEIKRVWLNDLDVGVAALWTSILRYPDQFKKLIMDFRPSVGDFHKFRDRLLKITKPPKGRDSIVRTGFEKLAIHQISYSGLGTKSGGPLGGDSQRSRYKIVCRWSPKSICQQVDSLHLQLKDLDIHGNRCTALDFADIIEDESQPALLYLDPPYYEKGSSLYQYGFNVRDHQRLAQALRRTKHSWLLSYDDCPEVRELYGWAVLSPVIVTYGLTGSLHNGERQARTKPELLISPP